MQIFSYRGMFSARASWLLTPPGTSLLCSYIILSSPGHLSPSPQVPAVGSNVKALGTLQESALAHLKSGHLSNQDARELGALEALFFHPKPFTISFRSLSTELLRICYMPDTLGAGGTAGNKTEPNKSSWSSCSISSEIAFPLISCPSLSL